MTRSQMPLALKPPRRPTFDNFVAGDNGPVVATLREGLEPGDWYFLGGPTGSGRSHLLSAVFAQKDRQGHTAHFLSLGDARQQALLDYAAGDWIVVDDVDHLAGNPEGERALFNALNRWRAERAGVLMSGHGRDRFELPDLRSRLGQATRLTLAPLDEKGLGNLVTQLAAEHEVLLGRGVVDYLLSRAPRNAGRIAGLIEQLADRALTERRTVSIPLVREVMRKWEV